MIKMQVGSRVVGKTKKTHGKVGVVRAVQKQARHRKFDVVWSDGSLETVSARSVTLAVGQNSLENCNIEPERGQDTGTSSFTALLPNSTAENVVDVDSDTSSDADDSLEGSTSDAFERNGEIHANDRVWSPCPSVLIDPGAHVQPLRALLNWSQSLAFGKKTLKKQYRCIDRGDWFKWVSIRLTMAFEPRRGPLPTYWEREEKEGHVGTAANYGQRFGMSRHCFEQIMSCMAFGNIGLDDPWSPIRPMADGFNLRRLRVVSPGSILCIDECMSAWKGREGKYCHDGIPHKTKIIRKPEGLGAELKALTDGDTGIMLRLELVEGVVRQRAKRYNNEYGEGASAVLRLAEPYRGNGRTIVADIAFSSVKTLEQLESRMGLFFMGIVKTATVGYPMQHMKNWFATGSTRGDCRVLSSTTDMGTVMYAACWADRKAKTIITNRGTTMPGTKSIRPRHRLVQRNGVVETVRYEKRIARPQMIELFFSKFSTIDIHNHLRRGSLAIEREWVILNWSHRLFSTLLGMIVVDAYLAYRHETSDDSLGNGSVVDFQGFVSQLAYQLIFNEFRTVRLTRSMADGLIAESGSTHHTEAFINLPQYAIARAKKNRAQRQCGECNSKASFYCVECSDHQRNISFGVCGPRTMRGCLEKHLASF